MIAPSCASSLRVSTVVFPTVLRYHETASAPAARLQHSSGTHVTTRARAGLTRPGDRWLTRWRVKAQLICCAEAQGLRICICKQG